MFCTPEDEKNEKQSFNKVLNLTDFFDGHVVGGLDKKKNLLPEVVEPKID
jgi:hypothetical protein